VLLAEKELTIEVRHFDIVIISDTHLATLATTKSHQSESLKILASKCTGSDHEGIDLSKLFLSLTSVDLDLVVVSTVLRSSVNWTVWKRFEDIIVEPLLQWSILARVLHNLLSNKSTEECGH